MPPLLSGLQRHARRFAFRMLTGIPPEHICVSSSLWNIMLWDDDEIKFRNNQGLTAHLDHLLVEMAESERDNTVRPLAVSVISSAMPRPLTWQRRHNILTTAGMAEMGKRSTHESSTTNSHHAVGTGATSENLADTALGDEKARKTIGSRGVSGTTERYSSAFGSADFTGETLPLDITEGAVFTAASGGIMVSRVTHDAMPIGSGQTLTFGTNISHQNGTEV